LILPKAFQLITPKGVVLALIKPQFELQRAEVGRGGIVREAPLQEKAQTKIVSFIENFGQKVIGLAPSVVPGTDGNREFFICARKLLA
jgi:23S rRNA (cytidine1920-2'-O)/16S rRNA (cytidine1409-2'-O)-methyltransferase